MPSTCVLLGFVAFAFAPAGAPGSAAQRVSPAKLRQNEEKVRAKAAGELVALAKSCVALNAVVEARAACEAAAALAPNDAGWRAEISKLASKKNHPQKDDLTRLLDRRREARQKAGEQLAPLVAAYDQADLPYDIARVVALMRTQSMEIDALVRKYDLVYDQSIDEWLRKKDVERFQQGFEIVDDEWCDPAKVKQLDEAHATWAHPWQLSDEAHEVQTTQPLHTARRVLETVGSFRRFVLGCLGGEVELRPPRPKLPVILTGTRAELEEREHRYASSSPFPKDAAAFYLAGSGVGNPCFVSFELKAENGAPQKVDLVGLRPALLHEVAHQILFEYLKWNADRRGRPGAMMWIEEGTAEFLASFVPVQGAWTLKRPAMLPTGIPGAFTEASFGWCREQADHFPGLVDFVTYDQARMSTAATYHEACGLVDYLLEGADGAHRTGMCRLIELAHEGRANDGSFAACLPGVDLKELDAAFRAWCRELVIDK